MGEDVLFEPPAEGKAARVLRTLKARVTAAADKVERAEKKLEGAEADLAEAQRVLQDFVDLEDGIDRV